MTDKISMIKAIRLVAHNSNFPLDLVNAVWEAEKIGFPREDIREVLCNPQLGYGLKEAKDFVEARYNFGAVAYDAATGEDIKTFYSVHEASEWARLHNFSMRDGFSRKQS